MPPWAWCLSGDLGDNACAVLTPLGDVGDVGGDLPRRRVEDNRHVAEEIPARGSGVGSVGRIGLAVGEKLKMENRKLKMENRAWKMGGVGLFCGTSKGPVGVMLGGL